MGCSLIIFIFHLSSEIWGQWTVRRTSKSIIFISHLKISAQNDKEWSDWISCYWNPCRSDLFFNAHSRGKWVSIRQHIHWLSLTLQLHWSRSHHVMMSEGNHQAYSQWDHYNFGIFTDKRTMCNLALATDCVSYDESRITGMLTPEIFYANRPCIAATRNSLWGDLFSRKKSWEVMAKQNSCLQIGWWNLFITWNANLILSQHMFWIYMIN